MLDGRGGPGDQSLVMDAQVKELEFPDPVSMARKSTQRSQLYGFLATVYRKEPTVQFLRDLKSLEVAVALRDAGVELDNEFFYTPETDLLSNLAVEYTRLFVGPGKHIPPCESVHVPGGDQLWGEAAVAVQRFISQTGIELKQDYTDHPDHISVELEFMQQLSAAEAEAWAADNRDEAQKCRGIEAEFLTKHLSTWASRFCERVIAETQVGYFREMAELTRDFIATDVAELECSSNIC